MGLESSAAWTQSSAAERRQPMVPRPPSTSNGKSLFSATSKRWLLQQLLERTGTPPVCYRFADGLAVVAPQTTPIATITFREPAALLRVMLEPDEGFAEGYCNEDIEVEGDLPAILEAIYRRMPMVSMVAQLRSLLTRSGINTARRSWANARHHYDLGNDFYKLWLDERMVYTCAYFPTPLATLEEAQLAKLDLVCRKLGLRRGETMVEAGSGWGALACHMASKYGVQVKAYNVSHEQVAYSRQRAKELGLQGQVEFIEDDWRNLSGQYDVFVSVGMLEHVGTKYYEEFGQVLDRILTPDGRGLLHFIGRSHPRPLDPWTERNLFPGARPPALTEALPILESHQFSVLDLENLRLHYAQTARHWLERYEAAADRVGSMFGQRFVRMWRLYLAGTVAAFSAGTMQLYQVSFARVGLNQLPWTRASLYAAESGKRVA